ncbi:MAG: GGDEF domain-containing protein [Endomicrobiales bacterium]
MSEQAKKYIQCAAVITVFLIAYYFVASSTIRFLSIYCLILVGLWFGQWFKAATIITNVIGIILLLVVGIENWQFPHTCLMTVLLGLMMVPFRFEQVSRMARTAEEQQYARQKDMVQDLAAQAEEYESHRRSLQEEIDKINQLYIMGRELVEHTEMADIVEHLGKVFLNRPGVSGMAVFLWVKRQWECAYCFPPENITSWIAFMKEKKNLSQERRFQILDSPIWLGDKAVVFWPVRIERYPLAAILLITDRDAATRYMDEGTIFIPQVALGIKRMQLFSEVKDRARNDGLTGLFVRRYFMERLSAEIQRCKRYKSWFSVFMIDIDFFKRINDTYGHLMGDRVLCALSRIFVNCAPPGGLVGRYGGEEFVMLIPNSQAAEVINFAKEINSMVALKEFGDVGTVFNVTVSIGMSQFPRDGETAEDLITAADKAMYWVKQNGRNGIHEFERLT